MASVGGARTDSSASGSLTAELQRQIAPLAVNFNSVKTLASLTNERLAARSYQMAAEQAVVDVAQANLDSVVQPENKITLDVNSGTRLRDSEVADKLAETIAEAVRNNPKLGLAAAGGLQTLSVETLLGQANKE